MFAVVLFCIVILDLEYCGYALLTEGDFIPSTTADDISRFKIQLICIDCVMNDPSQCHRRGVIGMPELHHLILVVIVADHIDIDGILDLGQFTGR